MSEFRDSVKELTQRQIDFICEEAKTKEEELFQMSDNDLYEKVYDVMCDIECAETPDDGEKLSERCKLASDIVTTMGNALASDWGLFDEETDND